MSTHPFNESGEPRASQEAIAWLARIDRGLTPVEQDDFFAWLAASPLHGECLKRCRSNWRRLDRIADWRPECNIEPNPDLLAPRPRHRWLRRLSPLLLAAASIAIALALWQGKNESASGSSVALSAPAPEDRRILPDQSVMKLNAGAVHTLLYTETERRVRLERGEAFFMVTKDPARPFVVEAGGVTVRAIGTAFNVRLDAGELDVLVAEGTVEVAPVQDKPRGPEVTVVRDPTVLGASQRVSLLLTAPETPAHVATLTRREVQQTLAWQHGLMTFQDQPLSAIVEELNRLHQRQLVLMDDAIASVRFSGTIRSDNLDGFARLLRTNFGADVTEQGTNEILVRTRGDSL